MTKTQKNRNLTIAVIISLAFLLFYNISSFAYSCQTIRDDVIRLHIIANSDSQEDQSLKLKVRDAILAQCPEIFNGTITPEKAKELIIPQLENLTEIAEKTISENGYKYNVKATIETEYFSTRVYDNSVTLPAGKYLALKIIIGEGNGKNWWCVMFPSLCLPATEATDNEIIESVFTDKEQSVVLQSDKYEIRFKLIEYTEQFKEYLTGFKSKK